MTQSRREEALARLQPYVDRARSFTGWDFPGMPVPRPLEPGPSWDYAGLVRERARGAQSALDLGTGGGEFVESVRGDLPALTVATEEWHVNAPIAHRRLTSLGADLVWCRSLHLPFEEETFDLVFDRHEELDPHEVARVLRPRGQVVTQQVGPNNWIELQRYFGGATSGHRGTSRIADFGDIRGDYARGFLEAGLVLTRNEQHDYKIAYQELGLLVFMLLITPWTIPDFDVERDLDVLLALEEACTTEDGLVMTFSRFLLVAEKPA